MYKDMMSSTVQPLHLKIWLKTVSRTSEVLHQAGCDKSLLQVFMVPGSSFMNLLAGSLYGTSIAVPFIAVASTVGSSGSFWLSKLLLKVSLSSAPCPPCLMCLHKCAAFHTLCDVLPM